MLVHWLNKWTARHHSPRKRVSTRRLPSPCRPGLEALEDRSLPTVSFLPAANYWVGIDPHSVAVGDFNGDGKQDLAAANSGSANVSVLLGSGSGTFASAGNFAVGG